MADAPAQQLLGGEDGAMVPAAPDAMVPVIGPAAVGAAAGNDAQQLLGQLVNLLQANVAPAHASTSNKHAARAPDKYMGDGSDRLSPDEFITAMQLYLIASKTAAADWAITAATHVSVTCRLSCSMMCRRML